MNSDIKEILLNSNKDIDNQQLMDYLSNQLSKTEAHAIEKQMLDDEFVNDAVEGLQKMDNKNLQAYAEQLNNDLQKKLARNKQRKNKRQWKEQPWTYLAITIILLLLITAYIIVKYLEKAP